MFYLVKMEYASKNSKINIFGLNMTVKSGLKNILKFLQLFILHHKIAQNWKLKIEYQNDLFLPAGISKEKCVVYVHMINKTLGHKFHPYLFHSDQFNDG